MALQPLQAPPEPGAQGPREQDNQPPAAPAPPGHQGHSHGYQGSGGTNITWMVLLGDGLHNLTDGLAIGAAFSDGFSSGLSTTVAVFCHELPHELGDFAMLLRAGLPFRRLLLLSLVSGLLGLGGAALGVGLSLGPVPLTPWVFGVTAGVFLYVALVDMLPGWAVAMAQVLRGTVTDFPGFDERADAETLRKAMKGLGTDEESILTLLTSRSNAQRQEIAVAFKTLFGRDLLDDLKSELTGKFEKLIVALMKPSRLYDAYELKHALKGAGTDEKILTEIIASRTPEELRAIKQVYEEEYGSSLEDDVVGDTSGYYQRMLVVLLQANRDPDGRIDEAQVEQDAQALFQAGELKWGTDEEKFITIFGTRSVSHLRRVFDKYMTISGFQIEETIDRETSGNLEQLLLAVVKSIRSIPAYLAETLYYAMKGAGTDDHTLIRVMVSRSEIDLFNIRKEFRKNFATSLYSMIKGDTSGDYKKALLLLCGGEDD